MRERAKLSCFCAITAKSLKVTFNSAVADTSALTFTTKRGTTTVSGLTTTWNDAKTEATLTSSANFAAGDYTVTVAGGNISTTANSGTVTIVAQKIGKIEFVGATLAKTAADKGTIGFKVYDQYNTEITSTATALVNAISWTASIATDSKTATNGVLTVDATTNFTDKQSFVITAVDSATGINKAVTVTVGDAAAVSTVTLGDNVLPTGKTRIYTGLSTAVTVPISGVDQYGNVLDTTAKLNGITLLSSDSGVVFTQTDVNSKAAINVNTTSLATAKTVVMTLVINSTGQTVTRSFDIVKTGQADVVTIGAMETTTATQGDLANTIVFPITVVNQFGETLTPAEVVAQKNAGNITVTSTGSLSAATMNINTTVGNKNYGKLVNTATNTGAPGVGTIVVTTATGKTASVNVTTKAARIVSEIVAPTTVTTNLVAGATSTVTYNYRDQYGDTVVPAAGNTNTALTWKYVVTNLTGDAGVITVNKTTGATEETMSPVVVTATAGKTGTAKVSAQLLNASLEVVSQVETTFTVTSNNASGLTYGVADVPTLLAVAGSAQGVTGADVDARPVTVTATDGTNNYAVPDSQIISITSLTPGVVVSAGQLGSGVTVIAQQSKWVIGADDAANITFATGSSTATINVRVVINTADGLKTVDKAITVSKAAPRTVELKITDTDIPATTNPYEIPTAASEISSFTFANRAAAETGQSNVFLLAKDQYGIWTKIVKDGTAVILNTNTLATPNIDANNGFELTGDKFILDEANNTQALAEIRYQADTNLTYSVVDGDAIKQFTVKTTAEELPFSVVASGTRGTANAGKIAAAETSIFTFDEVLTDASKATLLAQFKTQYDAIKGSTGWADVATATSGSAVWTVAGGKSVLTIIPYSGITVNTVSIPAAFTINKVDTVDAIGNAAGTTGTITVTP